MMEALACQRNYSLPTKNINATLSLCRFIFEGQWKSKEHSQKMQKVWYLNICRILLFWCAVECESAKYNNDRETRKKCRYFSQNTREVRIKNGVRYVLPQIAHRQDTHDNAVGFFLFRIILSQNEWHTPMQKPFHVSDKKLTVLRWPTLTRHISGRIGMNFCTYLLKSHFFMWFSDNFCFQLKNHHTNSKL